MPLSHSQQIQNANATITLSLLEHTTMVLDLLCLPFVVIPKLFGIANRKRTWARAFGDSLLRFVAGAGWNMRQMVHFMGSTTLLYEKWARQVKLEVLSDEIGEGAKLHWIGPRKYERVFLYFHGGGFSLPINPLEHLNFLYRVQKDLQASVGDVGVIAFEYSLTPGAQFPTQLRQFNAAISFLISKGTMPANIVLGGDSAGGNIAFQIASHIMHPLPNIPAPATSGPLAGALLISPWITFDDSLPSFVENDRLDTPNTNFFNFLADQFRSGITPETRAYFEPFAADDSWWIGLEKVFPRIICSAGEVECLRDSILAFGETLKKHVKDTTITLEKNGVHLDVLRDFAVGQGGKSDGYKVDIEWLSDTFKGQR